MDLPLTLNIIMYILIFAFTIFAWRTEHIDVHCPSFTSSREECASQGGMSFSGTKPDPSDSCRALMEKIRKAAGAEQRSIKWRRAFLLSVAIMGAVWVLVGTPGSLPDWKPFYISVLLSFAVLFGSYTYYSYHVYGLAEKWVGDALDEMERKGCVV